MAQRYANELGSEIEFNGPSTGTIINTVGLQQDTYYVKSDKPSSLNTVLHPAKTHITRKKLRNSLGLESSSRYINKITSLAKEFELICKKWKSIPDIMFYVNDNNRQQQVNTQTYQTYKIGQQIDDTWRICHSSKESATYILTSCTPIAHSLYKARHDKMLRLIYYCLLDKYDSLHQQTLPPWYRQSPPKVRVKNSKAKMFWDVQDLLETCHQEGANKPDIVVLDKENETAYLFQGTICEIGKIVERTIAKQNKYTDLRYGLKRLCSLNTVTQINLVMDFVGEYHTKLINELINLFGERRKVCEMLIDCQKWVLSQNCEIVKKF